MAQWGNTDTLADAPKYESPVVSFHGTDDIVAPNKITILHHGIAAGERVRLTAVTGGAPTGLTDDNEYWVIVVDTDTIQLSATDGGAAIATITANGGAKMELKVVPTDVVFVDVEEAASNHAKGLKTAGWTKYSTYVDALGNTRHKSEVLVAMKRTKAQAGDAGVLGTNDDDIVKDTLITITTQPLQADATVDLASNDPIQLIVAASAVPAQAVTYAWQASTDGGDTDAWATPTIAGATNGATIDIISTDADYLAGMQFRCVVSSTGALAAADAVSSVVTLTQSA